MPATVHIVDPGFANARGHHGPLNARLIARGRERGHRVRVLAYRQGPDPGWTDGELVPVFDHPFPYAHVHHTSGPLGQAAGAFNTVYKGLKEALEPALAPGDTVVMHSLTANELPPLFSFLAELNVTPIAVRLCFIFPLTRRSHPAAHEFAETLARYAIRYHALPTGVELSWFAETQELADRIAPVIEAPVTHLPPGIAFDLAPAEHDPPRNPVVLGLLGEARPEKGFAIVERALPYLFAERSDVRLVRDVHNPDNDPNAFHLKQHFAQHVEVHRGPFEVAAFYAQIRACSAVLLPYRVDAYNERGSTVLFEALGLGRPVLVLAGTSLARVLAQFDPMPGVVVADAEPATVLAGLHKLIDDYAAKWAAAQAVAPTIRARHDARAIADRLIAPPAGAEQPVSPAGA